MFNKKEKNVLKKIIFVIFLLFYDIEISDRVDIYFKSIKDKIEIYKIKNFLKFYSNSNTLIKKFKKRDKPKISIISAIYNREKFLSRLLKNLQFQNFIDIEIILVDDYSKDNSINLIKEFLKKDKRIILIRNKKNKGTFIARNIGILYSKGEYIFIPDPDDIISKDILKTSYKMAKKFNYDIFRFNIIHANGKLTIENSCKPPSSEKIIFLILFSLHKSPIQFQIFKVIKIKVLLNLSFY